MDYSINAKKKIFTHEDDTASEDEEQLIDDEGDVDNPIYEPSILYKNNGIKDKWEPLFLFFYFFCEMSGF